MPPRTRLACWITAVSACALSPILFNLIAPWAGALWQCLCLTAIASLYATTPADAIRLNPWVSKALILAVTIALPALCYGRFTPVVVAFASAILIFDCLHIELDDPAAHRRPTSYRVRFSFRPGPLANWLVTIVLWSPAVWPILAARDLPMSIMPALVTLMFMISIQTSPLTSRTPWPRSQRVACLAALVIINTITVIGFAVSPDLARPGNTATNAPAP